MATDVRWDFITANRKCSGWRSIRRRFRWNSPFVPRNQGSNSTISPDILIDSTMTARIWRGSRGELSAVITGCDCGLKGLARRSMELNDVT